MDLPKLPGVLFPPTMPLELTGAWLDNNWMCSNWLLSFLCDYYWVTFHCHRKLSPPPKALQTRSARHPALRFPAAFPASEHRLVQTDDLQTSWPFRSWHYFSLQGSCLCEDTFLMSALSSLSAAGSPCTALFQSGLISVLSNTLHLSDRDIIFSFKCSPFTSQNACSL